MSGKTPTDYFTSDVDGYEAKLYDTELKLVSEHTHSWTYTASGDTIAATCKNCEDNNGQDIVGGTYTITASDATYDGSVKTAVVSGTGIFENVDMSISYSKYNETSKQFESTNILPAGAGRYKASITYSGATAGVEYTIKKATREAPEGLTVSPAGSIGGKGKINQAPTMRSRPWSITPPPPQPQVGKTARMAAPRLHLAPTMCATRKPTTTMQAPFLPS